MKIKQIVTAIRETIELGDSFDIELGNMLIQTGVVGFTRDGGVVVEADNKTLALLGLSGALFESVDSQVVVENSLDDAYELMQTLVRSRDNQKFFQIMDSPQGPIEKYVSDLLNEKYNEVANDNDLNIDKHQNAIAELVKNELADDVLDTDDDSYDPALSSDDGNNKTIHETASQKQATKNPQQGVTGDQTQTYNNQMAQELKSIKRPDLRTMVNARIHKDPTALATVKEFEAQMGNFYDKYQRTPMMLRATNDIRNKMSTPGYDANTTAEYDHGLHYHLETLLDPRAAGLKDYSKLGYDEIQAQMQSPAGQFKSERTKAYNNPTPHEASWSALTAKSKNSNMNQGVAEGFPHDVDHMPGPVIRNADMTTDNVKTKDKAEWDRATDSINARVFDDMSEFRTDSKGETVVGDSAVWAKWDNATQTGWFNAKGRPLKPWPIKEQGVAEGKSLPSMADIDKQFYELESQISDLEAKGVEVGKEHPLSKKWQQLVSMKQRILRKNLKKGVAEDLKGSIHPDAAKVLKHIDSRFHEIYKPYLKVGVYTGNYSDRSAILAAAERAGHIKNQEGVAEGAYMGDKDLAGRPVAIRETENMVKFELETERAYQAIMDRFGDLVNWDKDGFMMVPEKIWPKVEMIAYDADGIGAQRTDDIFTNPEHYGKQDIAEAEYQGRTVPLGKPMQGDVAKSKVYVKGPKGNVVKVNFGDKNMRIKKSNPKRRKSFRARHNCDNPGPRWKARYWSCRAW